MDINNLVDNGISFFRDHTLWAILAVLIIGILIYWKPKDMFKLSAAGAVVGAIIFVLSFLVDLTSHGIDESRKFTSSPEITVD